MQRTPLDSRAVVSAGYDEASRCLELEFQSGRVYRFEGVPQSAYEWLLRTSSKGSFVSRMINGRYPFSEVHEANEQAEPQVDLEAQLRASLRERDRQR